MSDWLSVAGEIKKLTKKEMAWWTNREGISLGEIVSSERNDKEYGRHYFKFESVPQNEWCDLVQEFFKLFRPNECLTITWACQTGSYFGGGACFISATEDKWNHTGNWAEQQEKDFYGRQKTKKNKTVRKKAK